MTNSQGSYPDACEETIDAIRVFAAAECFRSATVDELELQDDFFRRPLRPEDLSFINLKTPVTRETICDLPSLASQRMLRCMYDQSIIKFPRSSDQRDLDRRNSFYNPANRRAAASLAPFLERFSFGFLSQPRTSTPTSDDVKEAFKRYLRQAKVAASALRKNFLEGPGSAPAVRFLMIQKWCLGTLKSMHAASAASCSCFDLIPRQYRPETGALAEDAALLAQLAIDLNVDRGLHTFWQFYLPTCLAETNYIGALASAPERAVALLGACYVAEFEWCLLAHMVRGHGSQPCGSLDETDIERASGEIFARFSAACDVLAGALGAPGLSEWQDGMASAVQLSDLSRTDLGTQLRWLAGIEDYVAIARQIDHRIRSERATIDRETFVEPREMCSTTHIHNDHRLVVVESGTMVFWGRPGMQFTMNPGEMVLVPRGRLHGSSVLSEQCVYHQPIIPEEWVRPLIVESDQRRGWATA